MNNGGETGIRTQDGVAPMPVFKTGAFNRSAISPLASFLFDGSNLFNNKTYKSLN